VSSATVALPPLADSRNEQIEAFLTQAGWPAAQRSAIPGDASFRRYERISQAERHAILMDAPPEKEDVRPFITVARLLKTWNLSAPEILAEDKQNGFLLLEDLGDASFTRLLNGSLKLPPSYAGALNEKEMYLQAVEVLCHLSRCSLPEESGIPAYDSALLLQELKVFSDWYLPNVAQGNTLERLQQEFLNLWKDNLLSLVPVVKPVLVMRDYHADNLMWLPSRENYRMIGLLDFQDATAGHPAYDLVSLLEDARRDVAEETVQACLEYYLKHSNTEKRETFELAYSLLGAQRNLKIIGIFHRLNRRDGKPRYLSYLPRVWNHLLRDCSHPALEPLARWCYEHLSEYRDYSTSRQSGC
jgi:aminoglycoside/choline kinase family phosphotransferase